MEYKLEFIDPDKKCIGSIKINKEEAEALKFPQGGTLKVNNKPYQVAHKEANFETFSNTLIWQISLENRQED